VKMVIAYINPYKLDEVREALKETGSTGLTAINVQGYGRQSGHTETYRGAEYEVQMVPKIRIEVLVDDEFVSDIVSTIETTARTGKIGDGKIAVVPLDEVIRIRTGERGPDAV
jgi:nitrogen regulatory protein P-II 1